MSATSIKHFDIAGNDFRAYYDAQNKLIFVIDSTVDERMPNVLLVLAPSGDRKWDDVLANDYGIDLETIRPKVNNRYQKMDIEYSGLAEYDALINAHLAGNDINAALENLDKFRAEAAWRAATARLETATAVAARTRDTIARTHDTISDLTATLKHLRIKLSDQRAEIGREPTKQSAAKILRTEAQIDATNAKLRRAKKRLSNAEKRLNDAENDAQLARAILARGDVSESEPVIQMVPTTPAPTAMVPTEFDDQDDDTDDDTIEIPPLLESDPHIIDDNIAFKPISFEDAPAIPEPQPAPSVNINIYSPDVTSEPDSEPTPAPIMFTPPTMPAPISEPDEEITEITEISEPDDDPMAFNPIDFHPIVDMPTDSEETIEIETEQTPEIAPSPVLDTIRPVVEPEPIPDVVPVVAPTEYTDEMRPTPPTQTMSDTTVVALDVVAPDAPTSRKPTALYYIMLIVLIVLSVFTLWLYQNNSTTTTPDLTAATPVITEPAPDVVTDTVTDITGEDPFISAEPVVEPDPEPVPEPVVVPEPEPAPVDVVVSETEIVEPTPVAEPEPEPEPEPVVVPEPEPVDVIVEPTLEPDATIQSEEEIIASKPTYNVSQNEEMFVADEDFGPTIIRPAIDAESEPTPTPVVVPDPEPVDVVVTPSVVYEPTPVVYEPSPMIYEPTPVPVMYQNPPAPTPTSTRDVQTVASDVFYEDACIDGTAPDANGCCGNEVFTDMEDGTFACCTPDGIDCFPPM